MTYITPSITAITETGARYDIDTRNKFWRKNEGPWEKIIQMKAGEFGTDWDTWEDVEFPEVGKSLFLGSLHIWWRSTPVEDIVFHGDRHGED